MVYLVLSQSSQSYAATISALLYRLFRPVPVRGAGDGSNFFCPWYALPDGRVVLEIDDTVSMTVDPAVDAAGFVAAIAHVLTDEEEASILAAIEENKGKEASPASFLPSSILSNSMTREELRDLGMFEQQQ